jgi:hypothetical protein
MQNKKIIFVMFHLIIIDIFYGIINKSNPLTKPNILELIFLKIEDLEYETKVHLKNEVIGNYKI